MSLIRHTGVYVKNLENMVKFYCYFFEMSVAVHEIEDNEYISTVLGIKDIAIELYKLKGKDNSMIELINAKIPNNIECESSTTSLVFTGCHHIAFTVKNLDDMYKKMLDDGIRFISQPTVSSSGDAYVCFCQDPEGNYLELVEELSE